MTELIVSLVLFVALTGGIAWFGYHRYARPARILERIGGTAAAQTGPKVLLADMEKEDEAAGMRMLRQLGTFIPVSAVDASFARKRLMSAGFRNDNAVGIFHGVKIVGAVLGLIGGIVYINTIGTSGSMRMLLPVAGAGIGYFLPTFFLDRLIARRQLTLRLSLPDALDLMVISVEAGLGLDQAIQHVSRELHLTHPEISEEWSLVNLEMRAGKRRSEALRNMAERTGEPELRKLIAILVQNDRFGTSMAESLRSHSDFMRTRRRQDAEERAGKVGVKLIFPIFFFILPSMMIVTAGPGILAIVKQLFPMMRNI